MRSQCEIHTLNVYQSPHPQSQTPPAHSQPWKPWAVLAGYTLRSFLTSSYRFLGDKPSRKTGAQ